MNSKQEYWLEALNEALESENVFDTLTRQQKEAIAKDLQISSECMSMAFYEPSEPCKDEEKERLKKRILELENQLKQLDLDFRNNVAMRHNCDAADVTLLGNGHAEYHY